MHIYIYWWFQLAKSTFPTHRKPPETIWNSWKLSMIIRNHRKSDVNTENIQNYRQTRKSTKMVEITRNQKSYLSFTRWLFLWWLQALKSFFSPLKRKIGDTVRNNRRKPTCYMFLYRTTCGYLFHAYEISDRFFSSSLHRVIKGAFRSMHDSQTALHTRFFSYIWSLSYFLY